MSEQEHRDDRRPLLLLVVVGVISCGILLLIAQLSGQFAITVPSIQRPHLMMWGLFTVLFGIYLAGLFIATRIRDSRQLILTICFFAVTFRLLLLFTTPIQEIDLYRYVWDGNVVAAGVDPYRFSPQNVIAVSAWEPLEDPTVTAVSTRVDNPVPADPLRRLAAVERRSPTLSRILRTIHYPELTTPYPPVSQAVFALAALTTPDAAAVQTHLIVMKFWIVLFDLLTVVVSVCLLKRTRLPLGWCLAYAWCPLVLKEFSNSGHLDSIAVFLTTASLWLLIRIPNHGGKGRVLASAGLLGLGIGAKLYPVVLLPIVLVWLTRQDRWQTAGFFAVVVCAVGSAVLWPMLGIDRPTEIVLTPPAESLATQPVPVDPDPLHRISVAEGTPSGVRGLEAFLKRWRMNDFLFLIINKNLDPSAAQSRQPWFAVVPDQTRMAIVTPIMRWRHIDASSAAFLITRAVTLGIFGLLTLWGTWTLWNSQKQADAAELHFLETAFLTLAWFWLLAPTQNPWYWIWCLPLLPFARSRAWLWVSGLVLIYYLRFWLNANWPEPPGPLGSRHNGASFFDFNLVWIEYGPLYCGLLLSSLFRRRSH